MTLKHIPVLLQESIDALKLEEGEIFLDGTFGAGGHSREVRRRFGDKVRIIGLDRDPLVARRNHGFKIETENFSRLDKVLERLDNLSPDAILLDLGVSSDQLNPPSDEISRGFSFQRNEPLDMRMSGVGWTAADILNSWDEHAIELILRGFGEERYSKKIAKKIVERREKQPFKTTFDLVEVVETVKPKNPREKIHPATKTFQALRIATNEELENLEIALKKGFGVLRSGGRLAVISFHSLEDRMVKHYFRELSMQGLAKLINKKPITASPEELLSNPRSRSAKLRIAEKI